MDIFECLLASDASIWAELKFFGQLTAPTVVFNKMIPQYKIPAGMLFVFIQICLIYMYIVHAASCRFSGTLHSILREIHWFVVVISLPRSSPETKSIKHNSMVLQASSHSVFIQAMYTFSLQLMELQWNCVARYRLATVEFVIATV